MYGNVYDDEERFERQAVFPKLLARHAEDFSWVRLMYIILCIQMVKNIGNTPLLYEQERINKIAPPQEQLYYALLYKRTRFILVCTKKKLAP